MRKRRVSEPTPIQVYLGRDEQLRLERLAGQLDTTKSEILRRGLLALEKELLDPTSHPGLRIVGLASSEVSGSPLEDAAREHDRVLADAEEAGWSVRGTRKTTPRGR